MKIRLWILVCILIPQFVLAELTTNQCLSYYQNNADISRFHKSVSRVSVIYTKARNLPTSLKKLIHARVDRDSISRSDLGWLHVKLLTMGAAGIGVGQLSYLYSAYMRYQGHSDWYFVHISNFLGIGPLLALDNILAAAHPYHRKKIAAFVYSFFGLANLYYETTLFGGNVFNDYNDLAAGGAAMVLAAALQYVNEKKELVELTNRHQEGAR